MNIKLAFTPVSQNPVDLLAVVLDGEKTPCTRSTTPRLRAPRATRAAAAFREKTLKREYFVTLPEGARAAGAGRVLEPARSRAGTSGRT